VLTNVAMFSVLFLLPLLIQTVQGHGALASGLVLLPQGLVMGLSTKLGAVIGERGYQRVGVIVGLVAIAITTASLLLIQVGTPLWVIAAMMSGRGLGIGLVVQPLLTRMLGGLPESHMPDANTLFNVGQRLGGSVGVSLLATYFSVRATIRVSAVLGVPVKAGATGSVPPAMRALVDRALLDAFHDAMWLAVGVVIVGVVFALWLPRSRPTEFQGFP